MSYTLTSKNLDGTPFDVEIGPGPGAPQVTKVVVDRWDNEDAAGSLRYLELHFYMPLNHLFKGDDLAVDIRVDATVDGELRPASDGVIFRGGQQTSPFVAVGTVWGTSSRISELFATITIT